VFWNDGPPSLQDGIFAATWVMDHAIAINPGGVNAPLRIAVLEHTGQGYKARLLSDEEIAPHRENVKGAKDYLRGYKDRHNPEAAPDLPAVPAAAPAEVPAPVPAIPE
jgi:hypothetical protein